MKMQKLFIPAYVLDAKFRQSLATGDAKNEAAFQAMLLKHESGAARIKQARSDHLSRTNTTFSVTP